MRRTMILALVLPFFVASSAHADFSLSDLESILARSRPKTVAETLKLLPADFRRGAVLMRTSRSLQSGTAEEPRAILSNADGSFVLTFNGDGEAGGNGTLEMMSFDHRLRRFEFSEVTYEGAQGATVRREAGRCSGCHGSPDDPHPIFEPFAKWPGAYGEVDDRLSAGTEVPLFRSFLERARTSSVYSSLVDLDRTHDARDSSGRMAGRPNASLLRKLTRLNLSRIADRVVRSPRYAELRVDLLATLYCVETPTFRQDFLRGIRLPDEVVGFEKDANSYASSAIGFFWLLARSDLSGNWNMGFGDFSNALGVRLPPADREYGSGTQELARAFALRDPVVAGLVGADGRKTPRCAELKALSTR